MPGARTCSPASSSSGRHAPCSKATFRWTRPPAVTRCCGTHSNASSRISRQARRRIFSIAPRPAYTVSICPKRRCPSCRQTEPRAPCARLHFLRQRRQSVRVATLFVPITRTQETRMAAKQESRLTQDATSEANAGRRTLLRGAAAAAACLGTGGMVRAADFPSKPVRLVVPFSAGGATDILGRLLGQAMEPHLKQPVVIDNRPGASGAIGAANVVQSPPDGYSVLMGGVGTNIVLAYTMPTLSYDPVKDLMPVAHVCNVDYVLAVAANSPYQTLDDLLNAARKAPKSISYMSTGPLGPLHVAMEYLSKQAGVSMVHVPYAGEAPSLPDLMTGRIDVAVMTIAFTKPLVADGRVRLLATISG